MHNVEYINNVGELLEEVNQLIEYQIVAKKVTTDNLVRFFIKRNKGVLIDTRHLNQRDLKVAKTSWIEVEEHVFNRYLSYINGTTKTTLNTIQNMIH